MKIEIAVVWVPSVEEDVVLFGVSEAAFFDLRQALRINPLLGAPMGAVDDLREWKVSDVFVRYSFSPHAREVLLLQIRPKGEKKPEWTKSARKFVADLLRFIAKEGLKRWLGF